MINVTYYLDIVSSWCFYTESTWAQLKERYQDVATFDRKVSLIPEEIENRAVFSGLVQPEP